MATQHIDAPDIYNPIYYWNNMYNPNLVRKNMHEDQTRALCTVMESTKGGSETLWFPLSNFRKDNAFNYRYHIPMNSYHLTLTKDIFPSCKKAQFIKKYGYEKMIPTMQIWEDSGIFSRRVEPLISTGEITYLYTHTQFMAFPDRTEIIIPGDAPFVSAGHFSECFTEESLFGICFDVRGDHFLFQKVFEANSIGWLTFAIMYLDTAVESYQTEKIGKKMNTWKSYVQYSGKAEYSGIYILTNGTVRNANNPTDTDNPRYYYQLDLSVKGECDFEPGQLVYVWAINLPKTYEPTTYHRGYPDENGIEDTTMKIETGSGSPVNLNGLSIYCTYHEYQGTQAVSIKSKNSFMRPIFFEYEYMYPNLYRIKMLNVPKHCLLRVYYEYMDEVESHVDFYDPLKVYFQSSWLENDFARDREEYKTAGTISEGTPEYLMDFSYMSHWEYDYKDFMNHAFYGDIRGYDTAKWHEFLYDHPALFAFYTRMQHTLVRVQKTLATSSAMSKKLSGRIENDTLFYTNDTDNHTALGDCCYVAFTTGDDIPHNNELFIDGLRVISHYEESMSHVYRIFFKPDQVTEHSEVVVTTCKHPLSHKVEANLNFSQKGDIVPFPDPNLFGDIAIGDTMVVDKNVGEYIDPDNFDYTVNVDKEYIYDPYEDQFIEHGVTDLMHLLTHDLEYYNTIYDQHIILDEPRAAIPNPPDMDKSQSNKVVDPSEIRIECKEEMDVNRDMLITNTTNGKWGQIPDCSNKNHNHKIIFSNWKEDPSWYRFRAYHNGYLLMDSDYSYTPPEFYGGQAIFDFSNFTEGKIILDYIPYREIRIYDGPLKELKGVKYFNEIYYYRYFRRYNYSQDDPLDHPGYDYRPRSEFRIGDRNIGILFDTSQYCEYNVTAQMVKVWIDGRILNPNRIKDTRALGYVSIDLRGYNDPQRITIYIDRMDDDCFEYKKLLEKDYIRKLIDAEAETIIDYVAAYTPEFNKGEHPKVLVMNELERIDGNGNTISISPESWSIWDKEKVPNIGVSSDFGDPTYPIDEKPFPDYSNIIPHP